MANILLMGLELPTCEELRRVLVEQGHAVSIERHDALFTVDAVFCSGDDPGYRAVVRRIRALRPDLPVVVVTRLPEMSRWLDALELGAADYCSTPFESIQIRWLLCSVLGQPALEPEAAVLV